MASNSSSDSSSISTFPPSNLDDQESTLPAFSSVNNPEPLPSSNNPTEGSKRKASSSPPHSSVKDIPGDGGDDDDEPSTTREVVLALTRKEPPPRVVNLVIGLPKLTEKQASRFLTVSEKGMSRIFKIAFDVETKRKSPEVAALELKEILCINDTMENLLTRLRWLSASNSVSDSLEFDSYLRTVSKGYRATPLWRKTEESSSRKARSYSAIKSRRKLSPFVLPILTDESSSLTNNTSDASSNKQREIVLGSPKVIQEGRRHALQLSRDVLRRKNNIIWDVWRKRTSPEIAAELLMDILKLQDGVDERLNAYFAGEEELETTVALLATNREQRSKMIDYLRSLRDRKDIDKNNIEPHCALVRAVLKVDSPKKHLTKLLQQYRDDDG